MTETSLKALHNSAHSPHMSAHEVDGVSPYMSAHEVDGVWVH